jgi:hypothetical protein
MRLTPRDRDEHESLNCQIHVDPAGNRGPWVSLEDGAELGSLESVLDAFQVDNLSDHESEVLQQWHRIRGVSEHARALERSHDRAQEAVFRFMSECEDFFKHAAECGFHAPPVPRMPGLIENRSIKVVR